MNNVFIGDSNINSFYQICNQNYKYLDNSEQTVKIYTNLEANIHNQSYNFTGASMYGITKDGRLKVGEHIKKITICTDTNYFFLFGFVDINFIILYKQIQNKHFCSYSFIRQICKAYLNFLTKLNRNIIILEIPYITIKDPKKFNDIFFMWFVDDELKELGKKYVESNPYDQIINISLTKYFNKILEKECHKYGITFIKYNYFVVDKYSNIKPKFIISDSDHHYKAKEILPIYIKLIEQISDNISS